MQNKHVIYEFEGFRLDPRSQILLSSVDGHRLPLKPKEFDALLFFVQHAGELLTKETLLAALWPGQVVEENNLNQYVTALRKLLGEDKSARRFIMNVRAKGYRFVPHVQRLPGEADASAASGSTAARAPAGNLVAWQCYQQAVHRQNTDQPERWAEAIPLFEKAVRMDPTLASAYAFMALSRLRLHMLDHPSAVDAIDKAREEARKAVELRPGGADGHVALGTINATSGRWIEAELNYLSARELDPEWVMPPSMHSAYLLLSVGHLQRAIEAGRHLLRDLGGLTSLATMHSAVCLIAGHDEEASEACDMALAMGAELTISPLADVISMLARRRQRFDEAVAALIPTMSPYLLEAGTVPVMQQVFAAIAGEASPEQTEKALDAWVAKVDFDRLPQSMRRQILLWYTQIGALDGAFALMNRSLDRYARQGIVGTTWGCLWLNEMAPFRLDPRFGEVARRMHLPDYWAAFGPPDGHVWRGNNLIGL